MISRKQFCEVYVPMARSGKSATEIGRAIGLEGEDKEVALKVSQRATVYRKQLKSEAENAAKSQGLNKKETQELVEKTAELMPKLKTRSRESESLSSFLTDLLAKADAPQDEGEDVPQDED